MATSMSTEECARQILEVVPLVMRDIRCELRSLRTAELTVPQFRALFFVSRNIDASLSQVADHMGLTLPSTSRLVDELIKHHLMTRQEHPTDRRRVKLAVTSQGLIILEASRNRTLKYLAEKLERTNCDERRAMVAVMRALRSVFDKTAKQV